MSPAGSVNVTLQQLHKLAGDLRRGLGLLMGLVRCRMAGGWGLEMMPGEGGPVCWVCDEMVGGARQCTQRCSAVILPLRFALLHYSHGSPSQAGSTQIE